MESQYKECGVVMLGRSANSAGLSNIILDRFDKLEKFNFIKDASHNHQHLYITSDDEIKEGDWVISKDNELSQAFGYLGRCKEEGYRKVIETTNGNIKMFTGIKNLDTAPSYPQPSDKFIQAFIEAYNKGEKIEKVLVEYDKRLTDGQECPLGLVESDKYKYHLKLKDNNIIIKRVKDSWTREEMKDVLLRFCNHEVVPEDDETFEGIVDKWIEENL